MNREDQIYDQWYDPEAWQDDDDQEEPENPDPDQEYDRWLDQQLMDEIEKEKTK